MFAVTKYVTTLLVCPTAAVSVTELLGHALNSAQYCVTTTENEHDAEFEPSLAVTETDVVPTLNELPVLPLPEPLPVVALNEYEYVTGQLSLAVAVYATTAVHTLLSTFLLMLLGHALNVGATLSVTVNEHVRKKDKFFSVFSLSFFERKKR